MFKLFVEINLALLEIVRFCGWRPAADSRNEGLMVMVPVQRVRPGVHFGTVRVNRYRQAGLEQGASS